MKAVVFGAATSGETIFEEIKKKYEIVAFADNDVKKQRGNIDGIPIIGADSIKSLFWDQIIIVSFSAMEEIKSQLLQLGIPEEKINTQYIDLNVIPRRKFCEDFGGFWHDCGIYAYPLMYFYN